MLLTWKRSAWVLVLLLVVPHVAMADPRVEQASLFRGSTTRIKIITGGDETSVATAQKSIANQEAYARLHGYDHRVHLGNYAHPWTAYWHKISALLRELQAPSSSTATPEVIVWMDLDVVVTNPTQKMLEQILDSHPKAAIILTEDPIRGDDLPVVGRAKRLTNTGVILVRRGSEARRVLERLFVYGRRHSQAAFEAQDQNTLHEQDAFNWLLGGPLGRLLGQRVAVIPQRREALNLNTFPRNLYDESYRDPSTAEWAVGDFAAHCSGLRPQLREWCVDDSCAAAEAALTIQLPSGTKLDRLPNNATISTLSASPRSTRMEFEGVGIVI